MKPSKLNTTLHMLGWIISDIIREQGRSQEFMNIIGTQGAFFALPEMFRRYDKEDIALKRQRDHWLQTGD